MQGDVIAQLNAYEEKGLLTPKLISLLRLFYESYQIGLNQLNDPKNKDIFDQFIALALKQIQDPYPFSIFHQSVRQPFDYYQFGLDFIRPFIDFKKSKIWGMERIEEIQKQLQKKENVILFGNHQIEPDPQCINLLIEQVNPQLAQDLIFVAGDRVTTDPLAIPLSLGCNLLCIYSKKHMDHPPEKKPDKVLHNQRTLKKMQELLNEGGKCIYVAPSGGRDRPNEKGEVNVSSFDSQSIEIFWLIGKHATHLTHFYPLSLHTYPLMPPPSIVEKELGEKRMIHVTPISLFFGKEIEMEKVPDCTHLDKKTKQIKRAEWIWDIVSKNYLSMTQEMLS